MTENNLFSSNNYVAIEVTDLAAAKNFYQNILGFKLIEEKENQLMFNTGHMMLFVDKGESSHTPVPSFNVSDFAAAKEKLLANGCTIEREGNNWLWFMDPFGMTYDIIGKKP